MSENNINTSLIFTLWDIQETWVSKITNELIKEYDCKTILEINLCEIIALSYSRLIKTYKLMDEDLNSKYPSKEKNIYLSILSKELDRENRNYLTAINALMEIKNPSMTINVNNTYLWKNQQFNHTKNENI